MITAYDVEPLGGPPADPHKEQRMRPGVPWQLYGTDFGTNIGDLTAYVDIDIGVGTQSVALEISDLANSAFTGDAGEDLDALTVQISSSGPPAHGAVMPGRASVRIQRSGMGEASTGEFIVNPFWDEYRAWMKFSHLGGLVGISEDHVVMEGQTLGAPYVLLEAQATVNGGGHAEIVDPIGTRVPYLWPPNSPNSFTCSYHVGLPALQGTDVVVAYLLLAPRWSDPPPQVFGLSSWLHIGPYDGPQDF